MASRKSHLAVILSVDVDHELLRIWRYNEKHRGIRQADAWDGFLRRKLAGLAIEYTLGRVTTGYPELRYVIFKKRNAADGHIAVFEIDELKRSVNVLHLFHTKMDVDGRLRDERG